MKSDTSPLRFCWGPPSRPTRCPRRAVRRTGRSGAGRTATASSPRSPRPTRGRTKLTPRSGRWTPGFGWRANARRSPATASTCSRGRPTRKCLARLDADTGKVRCGARAHPAAVLADQPSCGSAPREGPGSRRRPSRRRQAVFTPGMTGIVSARSTRRDRQSASGRRRRRSRGPLYHTSDVAARRPRGWRSFTSAATVEEP